MRMMMTKNGITIIIILFNTFMQGIYNYIPETNHVSKVYSVAAVVHLQFVPHVIVILPLRYVLHLYISTSHSLCAVPSTAVFCSSLISCFPGKLLRYCLSDSEMIPVAPIITSINFAFTFHMHWISIMRYLYFKIFSASFSITFLCPGIATSINMHVPFLLLWIMMSVLLLGIVLLVCTFWFHNMVTLLSWLVSTDFGTGHTSVCCLLISLHMWKYSSAHTLSCLFMYCSFASTGHADMMCSIVSSNCLQSLHLLSLSVCNIFVA